MTLGATAKRLAAMPAASGWSEESVALELAALEVLAVMVAAKAVWRQGSDRRALLRRCRSAPLQDRDTGHH